MQRAATGRSAPRKPERVIDRLRFGLRNRLTKTVIVRDEHGEFRFACSNRQEVLRAKTLFVKEEGTCAWIRETLRPGDVFFDVGANIGLYTLIAARQLNAQGRVYAFEPHAASFQHLCTNLLINRLGPSVVPLSIALNDKEGLLDFNYAIWQAGASASQLVDQTGPQAGLMELKYAAPIDALVERGWLPPPTAVKLDVDGREPEILKGMARLFASPRRPLSVQVEIQKGDRGDVIALMQSMGYRMERHHLTMAGKYKLAHGRTLRDIAYNGVFAPEA